MWHQGTQDNIHLPSVFMIHDSFFFAFSRISQKEYLLEITSSSMIFENDSTSCINCKCVNIWQQEFCFFFQPGEKARELNNSKFLEHPWNKNDILSKLLFFFFLPKYVIVHDLSYFSFLS